MKTPHSLARLLLLFALTFPVSTKAQQPEEKKVIINFLVEVNASTVNQLLQVVNAQIRERVHKITILISSAGGDPSAAFAAYNFLRGIPAEVTTFNIGNVDSAALILYCGGRNRYSLPGTRFLIHGSSLTISGAGSINISIDSSGLEAQLQLLKSLNQMAARAIASVTNKNESELEAVLRGHTVLTPEQAKEWGIVKDIKTEFMQPGDVLISVSLPPTQDKNFPMPIPANPQWRVSSSPKR